MVLMVICYCKALFHHPWYITKYTTHFDKFFILRGISQNIPRILTIFSLCVEYHKIYHGKLKISLPVVMCDGNDNMIPSFRSFKTNIIIKLMVSDGFRVLVIICHFKALFHHPWYITKYTTHFDKSCILRGISQNISRILTSFSFAWNITKYTTES